MAQLRRDEEIRAYERMLNPPLLTSPEFNQRFPTSSQHNFIAGSIRPSDEEDEITFEDVNRQITLIINIIISIVACSVALWMVSSRWSVPKRLGLSMCGSGVVGIAEVVVYNGYLRRLVEAKQKARKEVEIKEVVSTWVIGGDGKTADENKKGLIMTPKETNQEVRRRKPQSNHQK